MEMSSREDGSEEGEVGLGHLSSCSFLSLKYRHPTRLLGKHLFVLQHSSPHEALLNPPLCQTEAILPTLYRCSSLTNFDRCLHHALSYLFVHL